jgi:beta-glucosidase-like glycosyl hydrolase
MLLLLPALVACAAGSILPYTCAPGSPSASLPFCDYNLAFSARADDLLSRVNETMLVAMWSAPAELAYYEPSLNLKAIGWWQSTIIHGVCGARYNTTVFPHALAQAASFDTGLVARIGAATALEARIVNQLSYAASNGTTWANAIAAGGPLANTMHDARWGRAAECYGECPTLSAAMGRALLLAVQNRSAAGFVAVGAVARHWLGYHEAQPDLGAGGREFIDAWSFAEQQEAPYKALAADSEGVMCAMSAFSIGPRDAWNTSAAPLIPSCLHPALWATLRGAWASPAFVQTDCCDSLSQAWNKHGYVPSLAAAIAAGLEAGVEGSFGLTNKDISPTLAALLANGTVPGALLRQRLRRPLLARFRAGEFDMGANPAYPFAGPFDGAALDGAAHRALAREAAAASLVLLRNEGALLPLRVRRGGSLAVVGPWANCTLNRRTDDVDQPLACNYLHSYTGSASVVSTVAGAAAEAGAAGGWAVRYAQGSNLVTPLGPGREGVKAAAAAAAAADVTLLCLGLGTVVEREGLDRTNLTLPAPQAELLRAVSAAAGGGRRLVVVLFSGGMADLEEEEGGAPLAAGVVQAFYPGEETGNGLLDVLLGRVNPSARLPLTAFKQAYLPLAAPIADFTMRGPTGVGRTHRFFDAGAHPGVVSWWFGFGLSYTLFPTAARAWRSWRRRRRRARPTTRHLRCCA